MECGSEASAHAEASASALQKRWHAAPLSHAVGEGAGVRAKERARLAHSELKRCTLIRERAGSGGILHAQQFVNFDGAIGIIPIARAEFTIAPLRRFPPLREGNRVGRVGSPASRGEPSPSVPPACRGNLKEGVFKKCRATSAAGEGCRGARRCAPTPYQQGRDEGDQHPLPKLNSTCSRSASSTVPSQFTSTRPRLLPVLPKANNTASRSASSTQPLASTSPL